MERSGWYAITLALLMSAFVLLNLLTEPSKLFWIMALVALLLWMFLNAFLRGYEQTEVADYK